MLAAGAILLGLGLAPTSGTPLRRKKSQLTFIDATSEMIPRGEDYIRPPRSSPLPFSSVLDSVCGSANQIKVLLGDSPSSIIISFVSTSISGGVFFAESEEDAIGRKGGVKFVPSTPFSHSNLRYFTNNLILPTIGKPDFTFESYLALKGVDTSSWAVDPITGEKFPMYFKFDYNPNISALNEIAFLDANLTRHHFSQILDYRNPYAFYDSSFIHTAVLEGLIPGVTYHYQVEGSCFAYHFTVPQNKYPFTFGLIADVGVTSVSNRSMQAIGAMNPDTVIFSGDLAYADGTPEVWDVFGVLSEPVFANIPTIYNGGNHELGSFENWLSYDARYPAPRKGSGSTNPCYYAVKTGPATVITLCSYADFMPSSIQYKWLTNYLSTSIDRSATPWIIVQTHVPFYTSSQSHYAEGELMRRVIEPLLYDYGVDIFVNGHVHAYERTVPVYNLTADPCGTVHITIGDAGNYEGAYTSWYQRNINNSTSLASEGGFIAFREGSFGVAKLEILNSSTAYYSWNRDACGTRSASDPSTPSNQATAENNYNINLNLSDLAICSPDDGGFAFFSVDSVFINRPSAALCPNKHGQRIPSFVPQTKHLRRRSLTLEEVKEKASIDAPTAPMEFYAAESHQQPIGEAYVRPNGSSPRLAARRVNLESSTPCSSSEQIHVTVGDEPTSMVITYASGNPVGTVFYALLPEDVITFTDNTMTAGGDIGNSQSELRFLNTLSIFPDLGTPTADLTTWTNFADTSSWAKDPVTGMHWDMYKQLVGPNFFATLFNVENQYFYNVFHSDFKPSSPLLDYRNPFNYYTSPIIHSVTLNDLIPGNRYYYRVDGSCHVYSFVVPAPSYPFTLGIFADVGVTEVSNMSVQAMAAINPDVALLAGDMAYADGYPELWDTFGAILEPAFARIPLITCNGNHEMNNGENWRQYMMRHPTPYRNSGSSSPLYWAREIGPVLLIALSSYSGFMPGSLQYQWLSNLLSTGINRHVTPWVVVTFHVPMYTSNVVSIYEGELMRQSVEPLLYQYGVDIVVNGHIHAYERSIPVYNLTANPCGTIHITIGDSGNYEGTYASWRSANVHGKKSFESEGGWSAFREASFGVGSLKFVNTTHAYMSWHRHSCGTVKNFAVFGTATAANDYGYNTSAATCATPNDNGGFALHTSDVAWIVRPTAAECPNHHLSTMANTYHHEKH